MKVLVFGADGQLGWELKRTCQQHVNLVAVDFPEIDFLKKGSISDAILKHTPDCIINAAAYTYVDKAEDDVEIADRINHLAVREMAGICKEKKVYLVHVSTDFVFNGENFRPYLPEDPPNPISVYGQTKLKGEQVIGEVLGNDVLLIRTAWLYSSHGNNFVKTMIRLLSEKKELNVVEEQIGSPTWANGLAKGIWRAIDKKMKGIFHYTDAGVASWYDFAVAIQEEALSKGVLKQDIPIYPIRDDQYPTSARRPFYSVLDTTAFWQTSKITPAHWRKQLRKMIEELA